MITEYFRIKKSSSISCKKIKSNQIKQAQQAIDARERAYPQQDAVSHEFDLGLVFDDFLFVSNLKSNLLAKFKSELFTHAFCH